MDSEQLDKHLRETSNMIRRHRGRMISGAPGYQDIVIFEGFGPQSPVNEDAMAMADFEAAFIGNLARYCMAMGTVPRIPLRGFWWVREACLIESRISSTPEERNAAMQAMRTMLQEADLRAEQRWLDML